MSRKYCLVPVASAGQIDWGCVQNDISSAPVLGGTDILVSFSGTTPPCLAGFPLITLTELTSRKSDSEDPFFEPGPQ
jgi:hypothetical protein